MAQNNPLKIPNITEGIIRSAAITDVSSELSSVQEAVNVHYDRIGSTTVRNGLTAYSAVLSGSPISLGVWNNNTTQKLLAQVGNTVYAYSGGVWTSLGTNTTGGSAKVRYAQFIDYTYMVNGRTNDAVKSYDGSTYGTANTASLQKGDYISAGFDSRVWIGSAPENKVYYSDQIPVGSAMAGGTEFIYFSPGQGEFITGLYTYKKALLVFMQNSIFRIYGPDVSDPYPAYFVGTYSQESIVRAKDSLYFHHSTGFYRYSPNGEPQELSKRIKDIVEAIPRANYDDVFGWADDDNVYWHVGNVTIGSRTFRNLVVRYTLSSNNWTWYEYFNKQGSTRVLTSAVTYDDGVTLNRLVGVSDGNVANINTGNTDLGDTIFYDEIGRWYTIGELQSDLMEIKSMAGVGYGASGATLEAQIDQDDENTWRTVGTYSSDYVTMFNSIVDLPPFNRVRFRKRGVSFGTPPIFDAIEIQNVDKKGTKNQ
jgi:hypothetical protein